MTSVSRMRRQHDLAQRQERILDAAVTLVGEHGYHGLTMDRIAEAIGYSKGTVYQHFGSKEEVLIHLCVRNTSRVRELFRQVCAVEAPPRATMKGLLFAYAVHLCLHPDDLSYVQMLKSGAFRERTSEVSRRELDEQEQGVYAMVVALVERAAADGSLTLDAPVSSSDLVFGLWAMAYGGLALMSVGFNFAVWATRPDSSLGHTYRTFLDGLGWAPASTEWDYGAYLAQLRDEVLVEATASLSPSDRLRIDGIVTGLAGRRLG